MKIDRHGLKMIGLKKASGETVEYSDAASYDEVFYNMQTGEVWTVYQVSLGGNSWTEYHDPNIIKICNAYHHMTMQALADAIRDRVEELRYA